MSDSDLIRKALNIINESFLENDNQTFKRTKLQQDSNEVSNKEKDNDSDEPHKKRVSADKPVKEEDDSDLESTPKDSFPKESSPKESSPKDSSPKDSSPKDSSPKKESGPKDSTKTPKSTSPSNVDWAKHGFPGMGEGIYEGELEEGVNITLDGKEADDFVARLMQLSGQPTQEPAQAASTPAPFDAEPIPFDMDGAPAMGMDEPAGIPIDQPETNADHYVCDSCYSEPCECDSTDMIALETAEYDNVNADATDNIEEVDDESYIWKPIVTPQRMVKGTMGDNPMIQRESIERFNKIVNDYDRFLKESSNEEGVASPFTDSNRQEFDKDPNLSKSPKDDGSMSPMSQIKRQKVMK